MRVSLCDGSLTSRSEGRSFTYPQRNATEATELSVLFLYPPTCYTVQTSAVDFAIRPRQHFKFKLSAWKRPTLAKVRTTTPTFNQDDKRVIEKFGAEHSFTASRISL